MFYAASCSATQRIVSEPFHVTMGKTPDWVSLRIGFPPGDKGDEQGRTVRYLLSDTQVRIGESAASSSRYKRIVSVPLNETGLEEVSEIKINFNPLYQKLEIHRLFLVRDGETLDRRDVNKIKLIQREEDMDRRLYDGVVTAMMILDDVRVGDVVDYSYTVTGRNPVFGDRYFENFTLGWSVVVDRVRVRVVAPPERKLTTRLFNSDIKPQRRQTKQGETELLWLRRSATAVVDEGEYPKWYDPYPQLEVSEYRSWDDVSAWATELYRQRADLDGELRRKISEWQGGNDRVKAASEALRFVQDEVRYFGVELGQNSHRPTAPSEVFKKRYGDCKDKTLLLQAIFAEIGIEAYPALVSTDYRDGIAEMLPSPGVFNHVILMAKLGGERYWLDATRTHQRGGFAKLGAARYGKALLVGADEASLVDIDANSMGRSQVDVEERFTIKDYAAPVEMTVTTNYQASMAESQRRTYANNGLDKVGRHYLNFYARRYAAIKSAGRLEMVDDEENNIVTVTERYLIPDFWEREEGRLNGELVASTIGQYVDLPKVIQRTMPLALSHPLKVVHRSIVEYPDDVEFDVRQRESRIDAPEMSYRRLIDYKERRLSVVHEYQSREDAVMPEKMPQHIKQLRKIRDSLYYSFWVDDEQSREERVKNSSQELVKDLLQRLAPSGQEP